MDGVSSQRTWTFYTPRKGEIALRKGFAVLIDELKHYERKELVKKLGDWLEKGNDNQKYFAAEVIGYAQIYELKNKCQDNFKSLDKNAPWQQWQLNCLWAYSSFNSYETLIKMLHETSNNLNKEWIIVACLQMKREEEEKGKNKNEELISKLEAALSQYPHERIAFEQVLEKGKVEGIF